MESRNNHKPTIDQLKITKCGEIGDINIYVSADYEQFYLVDKDNNVIGEINIVDAFGVTSIQVTDYTQS